MLCPFQAINPNGTHRSAPLDQFNCALLDNMIQRGYRHPIHLLFDSRLISSSVSPWRSPGSRTELPHFLLAATPFSFVVSLRFSESARLSSEDLSVVTFQDEFYRRCQMHAREPFSFCLLSRAIHRSHTQPKPYPNLPNLIHVVLE